MWFSLSDQTAYFLWSIALGAAAAVLYDLVRAARMLLHAGKLHLLLSDVLFFTLCGVLTSLFALPFNKGNVRAFIVFGEAVGFLTFRFTIGRISGRFYSMLSKGIRRLLIKICDLLKKFFDLLLKTAARVVYNVTVLIDKLKNKASAGIRKQKEKQKSSRTVRKHSPKSKKNRSLRRRHLKTGRNHTARQTQTKKEKGRI